MKNSEQNEQKTPEENNLQSKELDDSLPKVYEDYDEELEDDPKIPEENNLQSKESDDSLPEIYEDYDEDLEDDIDEEEEYEELEDDLDNKHEEIKSPNVNFQNTPSQNTETIENKVEQSSPLLQTKQPQESILSGIKLSPLGQNNTNSNQENQPEITDSKSLVAATKGKSIAIMAIVGVVIVYIIFKSFSKTDAEKKASMPKTEVSSSIKTETPPPKIDQSLLEPQVPALPAAPKLIVPTAPPAPTPPTVPTIDQPDVISPITLPNDLAPLPLPHPDSGYKGLTAEQKLARLKSSMVLTGGGGGSGGDTKDGKNKTNKNLIDSGDSSVDIPLSPNRIKATRLGDLGIVIAEGKLIDAVLESAINSDLPGSVRAIVSMDVYSEGGNNVLIPKGSRLIGTYDAQVTLGMSRVNIAWKRIIRPDGLDFAIASKATDQMGRAGVTGHVDNHYTEILVNSLMISVINYGLAAYEDYLAKKYGTYQQAAPTTTSTTTGGTTTGGTTVNGVTTGGTTTGGTTVTTSTPPDGDTTENEKQQSISDSITNFDTMTKSIIQKQIDALKPTITIDQGTKIKVYVAHDMVFPKLNGLEGVNLIK